MKRQKDSRRVNKPRPNYEQLQGEEAIESLGAVSVAVRQTPDCDRSCGGAARMRGSRPRHTSELSWDVNSVVAKTKAEAGWQHAEKVERQRLTASEQPRQPLHHVFEGRPTGVLEEGTALANLDMPTAAKSTAARSLQEFTLSQAKETLMKKIKPRQVALAFEADQRPLAVSMK